MKFAADHPYASPEVAAKKLLELMKEEMARRNRPHAYTGTINTAFTNAGGTIAEYSAGMAYGIEQGMFERHASGTQVKPIP